MNKKGLRKVYLEKRLTLTPSEFEWRNRAIQQYIFQRFDFNSFEYVHIFLSIVEKNEVNTQLIIEHLERVYSCSIVIPKVSGEKLEHYLYGGEQFLLKNKWGIPEPKEGEKVAIEKLDIIFVPLVSFDLKGNRIGYGKGYYDKFLAGCKSTAIKVGLSLGPPLDYIPYSEPLDIPLDYCVYPYGVVKF